MAAGQGFDQRGGDIAGGALLAALGGAIAWGASRMALGSLAQPGPGMLPLALGVLLALCGVSLAANAWRCRADAAAAQIAFGGVRVWGTLAALIATAFAFEPLGYGPSAALLLALLVRLYSARGWLASLAIGAVAAAAGWVLFVLLLGVQLPRGLLVSG